MQIQEIVLRKVVTVLKKQTVGKFLLLYMRPNDEVSRNLRTSQQCLDDVPFLWCVYSMITRII